MGSRNFETVTANSEQAVRLCDELLEPAADNFASGQFAISGLARVTKELTLEFVNGDTLYVAFTATKLEAPEDLDEGERSRLVYDLTVSRKCPYKAGMFWPGLTAIELMPGDEIMQYVVENDENEGETIDTVIDVERRVVAEVWDFNIDDGDFQPNRETRWEYYCDEDDDPVAVVNADTPEALAEVELSSDFFEDARLREMDASLTKTYSEADVRTIVGLLDYLGFKNNFLVEAEANGS